MALSGTFWHCFGGSSSPISKARNDLGFWIHPLVPLFALECAHKRYRFVQVVFAWGNDLFTQGTFGLQASLSWKTRLSAHFRPPSRLICPNWCGNFVREVAELRKKLPTCGVRISNCGNRSDIGKLSTLEPCIGPSTSKPRLKIFAVRTASSKINSSVARARNLRPRDRSNHLEGESEDQDSSTPRKRGQQKDRPGPPRRDYSHLPVVDEPRELPEDQRICPKCGAALSPSNTEDSEQIEIEVRPYRRRIRRRRYQRTCTCSNCPRTFTAPPAPKLIPKGLLGISVWVEILIDKFFSHRPTERLLDQWRLLGLDLAAGTVAGGLERLEPLFQPLYEALLARNAESAFAQADETRWMVFIDLEGKTGLSVVAVGLLGRGHGGLSPGSQPKPRGTRGAFPCRSPRGADGRPLLGLQGHGPGEAGRCGAGFLLVTRSAGFRHSR